MTPRACAGALALALLAVFRRVADRRDLERQKREAVLS